MFRKLFGGILFLYFGNFIYFVVVNLDINNFIGQILGEFFKLLVLFSFYFFDNNFLGVIFIVICVFGDQFCVIEFNGNRLVGGFFDDFFNCYGFCWFVLSYNNFKGFILFGIGLKLMQLKRFDLLVNYFNGLILEDFGNFMNLLFQVVFCYIN